MNRCKGLPERRPASLRRRFAAISYDALLLFGVLFVFTLAVVALRGGREVEPDTWWFSISLPLVALCFYGWFWTHGGQTLGMRAWRIALRTEDAGQLTWRHAVVRYGAAWVSTLALGMGFWWSLIDREKRCWHDRWSHTVIVRTSSPKP